MQKIPTIKQIEKALNFCAEEWPGNCTMIAKGCLKHGLVKGKFRYGIWFGPISSECVTFYGRPFTHHAWIEIEDGEIIDPTRWVFEADDPYVFVGDNINGWYDAGGNELLRASHRNPPAYSVSAERMIFSPGPEPLEFVRSLLGYPPGITRDQLWWIATLPIDVLGPMAKLIYKEIAKRGNVAWIPYDNRRMVLDE